MEARHHLINQSAADAENLRAAMRLEAAVIASAHPDIANADQPSAPPVIARIPADLACNDLEVLVRHEADGVLVDIRCDPHASWTPLIMAGGTFEVRAQ